MKSLTIEFLDVDVFVVHEGDKNAGPLKWDEMLAHVAALTIPQRFKDQSRVYPLRVEEPKDHSFVVKTSEPIKSDFEPNSL